MHRLNRKALIILSGLSFVLFSGGMARLHGETLGNPVGSSAIGPPLIIGHQGSASSLERPTSGFRPRPPHGRTEAGQG
jgi:hypothetical protein